MGFHQQKHPRAQQRYRIRQAYIPGGYHPSSLGHLRERLCVGYSELRSQGSTVDYTVSSEQTPKVCLDYSILFIIIRVGRASVTKQPKRITTKANVMMCPNIISYTTV